VYKGLRGVAGGPGGTGHRRRGGPGRSVRETLGASARVVQVQTPRDSFWLSGRKVNRSDSPWIGQKETRRVSFRRIACLQVEQRTRTGAGPDVASAGVPSSPPSRAKATARGSRARILGETEGVKSVGRRFPACTSRRSRGPLEGSSGVCAGREKGWEVVVSRLRSSGDSWNAISREANVWLSLSRSRWSNGQGGIRGEKVQTSDE
jgi:hypothetical protein